MFLFSLENDSICNSRKAKQELQSTILHTSNMNLFHEFLSHNRIRRNCIWTILKTKENNVEITQNT